MRNFTSGRFKREKLIFLFSSTMTAFGLYAFVATGEMLQLSSKNGV